LATEVISNIHSYLDTVTQHKLTIITIL